jgi:hypothetical protein
MNMSCGTAISSVWYTLDPDGTLTELETRE